MTCPDCCYPNSALARRCGRCYRRINRGLDLIVAVAVSVVAILVIAWIRSHV